MNKKAIIISPSGAIDEKYIDGAKNALAEWEFSVQEGKSARGKFGRFAGTEQERISDLQQALDDENAQIILCSRGGYGLVQIIDKIDFTRFIQNPKTIVGFSDITVLHNALAKIGIPSVHAIMAKHLTELPANAESVIALREILNGVLPKYQIENYPLNRKGEGKGKLAGGNLSVIYGLRSTPYDLDFDGKILFIEDICEKPYHIDRMMQNLRLGKALENLAGLVVGQFAECTEDPLMNATIYEIILNAVKNYDYPVCFNFPAGHAERNLPLVLGGKAVLKIDDDESNLEFF
ncbi:MAG: LD-carboxypeptidase [Paludibacter sp.]|nr:LD-carboxypeptidase [Paludibacter sp.]